MLSSGCGTVVGTDKVLHTAWSGHLCCLSGGVAYFSGAGGAEAGTVGAAVALAAGMVKEIADSASGGSADWSDLLADAAGTALGLVLLHEAVTGE
jgi:uncharacterized protein YfiM (DUF2279 family)